MKLTKRFEKPAEWIGLLDDGEVVYIVADHRSFKVAVAADIFAALCLVKDGDCAKVKSEHWDNAPTTAHMLKATGINLNCEVLEKISGEILPPTKRRS